MAPTKRMVLKTPKEYQTPGSVEPKRWRDVTSPADATKALTARGKKAWWPCMTPSATKVTPLMSWSSAPIIAGARAASRIDSTGVKTLSSGSAKSWQPASSSPAARPQPSMRSATSFAPTFPPPFSTGAFSVDGTSMAATEDKAKSTTPPNCHVCIAIVCAAAASPVGSSACVARVTQMKAVFMAMDRLSTPNPPTKSGAREAGLGGFTRSHRLRAPSPTVNTPRRASSVK
mmetsp:Transcript_16587/g.57203  ORF Transcript_16587/g.57203 Transcript_16587/m.57203 type:complete len:231 (-) Transcript_16587:927-1619(-)